MANTPRSVNLEKNVIDHCVLNQNLANVIKERPSHKYALYLVPAQPMPDRQHLSPELQQALAAIENSPNWGGQIHITLCSFAKKASDADANLDETHLCSLNAAAAQSAEAATAVLNPGSTFNITTEKWQRSRSSGSVCIAGNSRTLTALTGVLSNMGCYDTRTVPMLHVTMNTSGVQAAEVINYLASCLWDVAVAKVECDANTGQLNGGVSLVVRERYMVGEQGGRNYRNGDIL